MTEDVIDLPKYARVAAAVRAQIADGTLLPGQPAPSGAALSRLTGYSTLTCRRGLRVLIANGTLVPGPSRNARPRVAGAAAPPAERDLAAAGRALSAGLAGRRRAARLTQPRLAALVAVSVTTIGHAETGRLWQSRKFWERADAALSAGGGLLRLHDAFRAASTGAAGAGTGSAATGSAGPASGVMASAPGEQAAPVRLTGTGAGALPALGLLTGPGALSATVPLAAADAAGPPGWPGPAGHDVPWQRGQAASGALEPGQGALRAEAAGPARVTIVWGDGTVTTVHPPWTSRPGELPVPAAPPD